MAQRYSSTLPFTSALEGVGGQHHAPADFTPRERPGTHCLGGWTGAESLVPTGIRCPDRPASSESLYQLSYSGPP